MADQQNYDGFISYSHAADDLLAPRLQAGLQRFAKPWWKRRAVRIFRDESSLAANPHLWSSITEALDSSGWFVLLLSPDAAESEWVGKEIEHWKANQPADRILPVVTDGEFGWSDGDVVGSSVPPALHGVFSEEPRWVDLRFARGEETLDLKNPAFAAAIADVASSIRGIPKDDLASEEVHQHRRTVRTAWVAGVVVLSLGVMASLAAVQASRNAALAKSRELAASAINLLDDDPELATLLTLEAMHRTPDGLDHPVEVVNALWEATAANRFVRSITNIDGGRSWVALAADDSIVVMVASEGAAVRGYSATSFELLWEYVESTTDTFDVPSVSPDGTLVAVPVLDSTATDTSLRGDLPSDDLEARMIVLDSGTGDVVATLLFPGCDAPWLSAFSPTGGELVVTTGIEGCARDSADNVYWADVFDTTSWERTAEIPITDPAVIVAPGFLPDGTLHIFRIDAESLLYSPHTYDPVEPVDSQAGLGFGVLSPDGTQLASFNIDDIGLRIFTVGTGSQTDYVQQMLDAFPSLPSGLRYSPDGQLLIAGTEGPVTLVWDAGTGEQLFRLRGGPAWNVAISTDNQRAYTAHDDSIKVWDLSSGSVGRTVVGDLGDAPFVNGNGFTIGPSMGYATLLNLETGLGFQMPFNIETGAQAGEAFETFDGGTSLPDGGFVYARPDTVWVKFDPSTGNEVELIGCVSSEPWETCVDTGEDRLGYEFVGSVEGSELAAIDENGVWTMFDPLDGRETGESSLSIPGTVLAFGPEWVLVSRDPFTVVVDRFTGETLWEGSFFTQKIEIATSGDSIALKEVAESVWLLEVGSWELTELSLGFSRVRGMAFDDDETRLAVSDTERLRIVNLVDTEVTAILPIPGVSDIYWLNDDLILIGTADGEWATVSLDTGRLISATLSSLTRSFTDQECSTYRIDPCPTLSEIEER